MSGLLKEMFTIFSVFVFALFRPKKTEKKEIRKAICEKFLIKPKQICHLNPAQIEHFQKKFAGGVWQTQLPHDVLHKFETKNWKIFEQKIEIPRDGYVLKISTRFPSGTKSTLWKHPSGTSIKSTSI